MMMRRENAAAIDELGATMPISRHQSASTSLALQEVAARDGEVAYRTWSKGSPESKGFIPGGRVVILQGLGDGSYVKLKPGPIPSVVTEKDIETRQLGPNWICYKFTVVDRGNGEFAFHSPYFNRFLRMRADGSMSVTSHVHVTDEMSLAPEKRAEIYFKIVDGGGDFFGFWNVQHKRMISISSRGITGSLPVEDGYLPPRWGSVAKDEVKMNVFDLGPWKRFDMQKPHGSVVSLFSERYLRYMGMKGTAETPFCGISGVANMDWTFHGAPSWVTERWVLLPVPGGDENTLLVGLHNPYWNRYAMVVAGDNDEMRLGVSDERDPDLGFPEDDFTWEDAKFQLHVMGENRIALYNENKGLWIGISYDKTCAVSKDCAEDRQSKRPYDTVLIPGPATPPLDQPHLHWRVIDMAHTPGARKSPDGGPKGEGVPKTSADLDEEELPLPPNATRNMEPLDGNQTAIEESKKEAAQSNEEADAAE